MAQKNKNILLLFGLILLFVIGYQMAISKTIALKSSINTMKENNLNVSDLARLSSNLSQREKFADSLLKTKNIKNTSIQNSLLEFLNKESLEKGFSIEAFLEPHISFYNEVKITSYQFKIKGNFNDLDKVLYKLEQEYNLGQISHASFKKKRNFRKGKDFLECTVIVESFISE